VLLESLVLHWTHALEALKRRLKVCGAATPERCKRRRTRETTSGHLGLFGTHHQCGRCKKSPGRATGHSVEGFFWQVRYISADLRDVQQFESELDNVDAIIIAVASRVRLYKSPLAVLFGFAMNRPFELDFVGVSNLVRVAHAHGVRKVRLAGPELLLLSATSSAHQVVLVSTASAGEPWSPGAIGLSVPLVVALRSFFRMSTVRHSFP
jgi:hypothetical protein